MNESTIRPRPGDLEAACKRHTPVPSGERVSDLGPERCDLCGLSWGSPMHESATPYTEQETTKVEERPDDDPAPVATCNGRDCGGRPHE